MNWNKLWHRFSHFLQHLGKYTQETKESKLPKAKEVSDKVSKHTKYLYSMKIYNVYRAH